MRLMTLTHCQLSKSRKKSNAIFIHVKNVKVNMWLWQCLERPQKIKRNIYPCEKC